MEGDTVIEQFADINTYPSALSPSTFVIVRQNKKDRNKPYDYPQILHPNQYFATTLHNEKVANGAINPNYITNSNHQILSPYTSVVTTHETNTTVQPPPQSQPQQQTRIQQQQQPIVRRRSLDYYHSNLTKSYSMTNIGPQPPVPVHTQPFRTPISTYQYQPRSSPSNWHHTGTNVMDRSIGYTSEPSNEYLQRDFYYPNRSNIIERTFERKQEPRVLHYYTGYDYFATVDPSDPILTRHHSPIIGPGTAIRYNTNPPYHYQSDYIKSTM